MELKIRERTPVTLDEALRAGQKQEVWNKDAARLRADESNKPKATRAAGDDQIKSMKQQIDQLKRQVDQANRRPSAQVPPAKTSSTAVTVSAPTEPTTPAPATSNQSGSNEINYGRPKYQITTSTEVRIETKPPPMDANRRRLLGLRRKRTPAGILSIEAG